MLNGYFLPDTNLPYIRVAAVFGSKIVDAAFVLDTGFSGDLKIDEQTANELGIFDADEMGFTNANGDRISGGFVYGYAEMEGRRASIKIIIVNGAQLAGMRLFSAFGYKIVINAKNRTAHLETAA